MSDFSSNIQKEFTDRRQDYSAALPSRFKRIRPFLWGTADAHTFNRFQFNQMREYARDMERNDWIIKSLVSRVIDNTIQHGFRFEPNTGDTGLDKELKARWKGWSMDPQQCCAMGEFTFWEMERLVLHQKIVDGDIFALPLEDGSIQFMEADRCQSPNQTPIMNCVHGILLDDMRRRLEYWFTKDAKQAHVINFSGINRYPAYQEDPDTGEKWKLVFHVYDPFRCTQTRGITDLHPIFDVVGMTDDLQFAKLVQHQMVSMIGQYFERPMSDVEQGAVAGALPTSQPQQGPQFTHSGRSGYPFIDEGLAPGQKFPLPPGWKMSAFSPNVPNPEFFEHIKLMLTVVGINLGMPLCMVLMDAKETNFSGYRGAIDQARMGFRNNQKVLRAKFHYPVWKWKVRQWLPELGASAAKLARTKELWNVRIEPPGFRYIQPHDDAQGEGFARKNLLISPRRQDSEKGLDHEELIDEILEDNGDAIEKAIKKADEIFKSTGVQIGWRDILDWDLPSGIRLSGQPGDIGLAAGEEEEEPSPGQADQPKDGGKPDGGKPDGGKDAPPKRKPGT